MPHGDALFEAVLERAPWAQQLTRLTLSAVWPPIDLTTLWHRVSRWAALRELVIHDSMTVERVEGRVKITFKPWWEEAVLAWLKQSDLALGEVYCRVDRPLVQREALEARIEALGGRLVEEAKAV